ncbi:MAG: NmrA-like family protein [Porphyromonadaceae bacterium CG2_30_38_12]|nr:MAG: NmrA-like family protein [Porphyromonadaceae bacterium CG2_30_38_12]
MKRILITGATGNVGSEVIRFLMETNTVNEIIAGVRNIDKARESFKNYPKLQLANFDFENQESFDIALAGIDTVFLLRPPHISDIETYFEPLINKIKEKNVTEIVFLSVQGAELSKVIPHNKIERLITESGCDYIFLRPSYFMQNLTTTLLKDIQTKRKIVLPAGKAKFNWIDIENIGEVCAILLNQFSDFKNQSIELTGTENEDFYSVADKINQNLNSNITFQNVSPFKFYSIKKNEGLNKGLIIVMIMLHFLPRFQKPPRISDFFERVIGKKPTTLSEFIKRERNIILGKLSV